MSAGQPRRHLEDRAVEELPLFVWLSTQQAPPWVIRAAFLNVAVHRALKDLRYEQPGGPTIQMIMTVAGRTLLQENDRLLQDILDIDLLGLRKIIIPKQ